jgi:hypothetical protein
LYNYCYSYNFNITYDRERKRSAYGKRSILRKRGSCVKRRTDRNRRTGSGRKRSACGKRSTGNKRGTAQRKSSETRRRSGSGRRRSTCSYTVRYTTKREPSSSTSMMWSSKPTKTRSY